MSPRTLALSSNRLFNIPMTRCRTLRASPKSDNGIGKGFKVIVLWGAVKPFSTIFSGGKESSWDFSSGLADFFKLPLREGPCRSNSLQSWQSAVVRPTTHSTNTNARLKHTVCRLTQFIPYSQSHWTHTHTHTHIDVNRLHSTRNTETREMAGFTLITTQAKTILIVSSTNLQIMLASGQLWND